MEIIFAGGSHYDTYGFESLKEYFDKVYVLKDFSDRVVSLMRATDKLIDSFFDVECKYIFLCGYPRLITKKELEEKVFINVHGALLPKYRGMHSTYYAIMNGETKLGITFHLVDEFMDSGPILAQFDFDYAGQIVNEINRQIDNLVGENAGRVCQAYIDGVIIPVAQDESKATFGARRNLDDCFIDFNMPNIYLRRFFNALTPFYPQPMLKIKKKRYEVVGNYIIKENSYYGPIGRAVNISDQGVWIKVLEGFLIISELRDYETKEVIKASSIVPIGYRFE